jgi:hypothetical protein
VSDTHSAGLSPAALPANTVRLTRGSGTVELYFPPFRTPGVALALGAFGFIATAIAAIGIAALLPGAIASSSGLMAAVLVGAFIVPFAFFGLAFVVVAMYMVCNALLVRIDRHAIETWRILFGVAVSRNRMAWGELATIEPRIAARHQSVFTPESVFELVALNDGRSKRLVVAESLQGAALMELVKALIEDARDLSGNGSEA